MSNMMKERGIVIIGSGISSPLMSKITENLHSETIIVDAKTTEQSLMPFVQEPFVLSNPYPIKKISDNFICKGKHQYRHTNTIKDERENGTISKEVWSCQCGKVLGS